MQLAILGVILALLFEKTSSLWPCIMLHAINNTLAFIYSDWLNTLASATGARRLAGGCGACVRALERR